MTAANRYDELIEAIDKREISDADFEHLKIIIHFVKNIRAQEVFGIPFISDMMGEKNPGDKLTEWIGICPAYGADFSVLYKRVDNKVEKR